MQTFLPYKSFAKSAACLDDKRLGKQRVEAVQLLNVLLTPGRKGWANHPAALMWKGHEGCLFEYTEAICAEWVKRGFRNELTAKNLYMLFNLNVKTLWFSASEPPWLGSRKFHAAHRSNLLRKDPVWYGKFGWKEPPDLEYVWTVRKETP